MTDISMIAQLREFGFTESEAKVYVALLEGGAVSGYEASKLSGVARSKIYTILEALIQRGAVLSSSDGRATLYRAESPAHLAELLRGEMDRGLRNLALAAEGLVCGQNDERIWHLGSWESAQPLPADDPRGARAGDAADLGGRAGRGAGGRHCAASGGA